VKDVATDLRSQENLIILMEFLLAKTFHFFDVKESMRVLQKVKEHAIVERGKTEES